MSPRMRPDEGFFIGLRGNCKVWSQNAFEPVARASCGASWRRIRLRIVRRCDFLFLFHVYPGGHGGLRFLPGVAATGRLEAQLH